MSSIIVTNNEYVNEKYKDSREMIFLEGMDYLGLLEFVRGKIHEGHELLTHPLSGRQFDQRRTNRYFWNI